MSSYMSNREIAESIRKIEEKHDLLKYKEGGWCLWPRIRWHVIRSMQHRPDDKPAEVSHDRISEQRFFVSNLWKMLVTKPGNNLIYTFSRFRQENYGGLSEDIHFDEIMIASPDSFIKTEQRVGRGLTPYNVNCLIKSDFSCVPIELISNKLAQFTKQHPWDKEIDEMLENIEPYLENDGFSKRDARRKIYDFYYSLCLYKRLYKKLGIKRFLFIGQPASMIAAAKELGVETIEFQHGFVDRYHHGYCWSEYAKEYKEFMPLPDKIFLYGDCFVDELKKTGFWDQELIAVGSSQMEKYRKAPGREQEGTGRRLNLLLTTQGFDTDNLIVFIKRFIDTVKKKIRMAIKLHPQYDTSLKSWVENFSSYNNVFILTENNISTLQLIKECDFHLTIWSTTHYEALGLGKPTIVLPLAGWENVADLIEKGYAYFAKDPHELASIIENSNPELNCGQEISEYFYKPFSVENIANAINL